MRFWLCGPQQLRYILAASNAERETWPAVELPASHASSRGSLCDSLRNACAGMPGDQQGFHFQPAALPPSLCDLRQFATQSDGEATRYYLLEASGDGPADFVDLSAVTGSERSRAQLIRSGTLDGQLCVVVARSVSLRQAPFEGLLDRAAAVCSALLRTSCAACRCACYFEMSSDCQLREPQHLSCDGCRGMHICMHTHSWPNTRVRTVEPVDPLLGDCPALLLCTAHLCRLTAADESSLPSRGAGRCIQCTHPAVASRQKPGELHVLCQTCLQCILLDKRVSASHSPPLAPREQP